MKFNKLLVVLTLAFLSACVEDNLDFPNENPEELSGSYMLISYLNSLSTPTDDTDCFDFIYPLTIGYNNGITISIENKSGLLETAKSQRSSFHITGISFPFLVNYGNELLSIENESDLFALLETCDVPTFRDRFDETLSQCYTLTYPLSILDASGGEQTIQNEASFDTFLKASADTYQPLFIFPIRLVPYATDQEITINSLYDFFQVLNTCQGCPEISFAYDDITDFQYRFVAEISDEVSSFDWYINDQKIKTGSPQDLVLEETFTPGFYNVCIKSTTDYCNQGVLFCEEFDIESVCPELYFEPVQGETNTIYTFFAEFDGMNSLNSYSWHINGDVVEVESSETRDNKLFWQFETGIHEVCLQNESPQCPEGAEYCQQIAAGCLPLDYLFEEETYGYVFTADFEGKELITYIWNVYVNDELIKQEIHEPGDEDHTFTLDELEPGVTYEVCLKQDGPCLDQQACKTFTWQ